MFDTENSIQKITGVQRNEQGGHSQRLMIDGCGVKLVFPRSSATPNVLTDIRRILLEQKAAASG